MARQPNELPPSEHETLAVSDVHFVGANHIPRRHHTIQRIRALGSLARPMTSFPYRWSDAGVAGVTIVSGGSTATEPYLAAPGIHAVDIILDEPLEPGQEMELEYATRFNYREPPPPEFRRAVGKKSLARVGITVVFDGRPPAHVWQTEWDGYAPDSNITAETAVQPMPYADDRRLMGVQFDQENVQGPTTLGFRWEWAAELR